MWVLPGKFKMEDSLKVAVRDREKIIFEGEAESITSYNKTGKFDILPRHANFISLVSERVVINQKGGGQKEITLVNGVLKVSGNEVKIFASASRQA